DQPDKGSTKLLGVDPFSSSLAFLGAAWGFSEVVNLIKEYPIPSIIAGAVIGLVIIVKVIDFMRRKISPVKYYINALNSKNKKKVEKAKAALIKMGRSVVPSLIDTIDSPLPFEARINAADVLSRSKDPRAVEPLVEFLEYDSNNLLNPDRVTEYIVPMGDLILPRIFELLSADTACLLPYHYVIRCLGAMNKKSYLPLVVDALDHDDELVRASAVWALGKFHATETSERLVDIARKGKSRRERIEALRSLRELGQMNDRRLIRPVINYFGRSTTHKTEEFWKTCPSEEIEFIGEIAGEETARQFSEEIAKKLDYNVNPPIGVEFRQGDYLVQPLTQEQIDYFVECVDNGIKVNLKITPWKTRVKKVFQEGAIPLEDEIVKLTVVKTPAKLEIEAEEKPEIPSSKSRGRGVSRRAKWEEPGMKPASEQSVLSGAKERANNIRTELVDAIKRLKDEVKLKPTHLLFVEWGDDLKREDYAFEIKTTAKWLIGFCERYLTPEGMDEHTRKEIDAINEKLPEFEVHSLIEAIILRARDTKRKGESLIIGLDASWIPDLEKEGSLQHNALSPLMKEIYALGDTLKAIGLDNVVIVHENSDKLADKLMEKCTEKQTDLTNVVVLASKENIGSPKFDPLKSTQIEKKAFLAGVDGSLLNEFMADKGPGLEQLNINILDMITVALELAAGRDELETSIIQSYDKNRRILILCPNAEALDYQKLREEYKSRLDFLRAA
ncbi:MAG: hypothetical protein GF392_00705, partial [Candidatus Omnitrophica bacterium]|nr:hypothetical protein [Candidatus Omnitrophota bacterium]